MRSSTLLSLAASLSTSTATFYQGFNYGATRSNGSFMYQADFQADFQTAKNLVGTSGFTSARLYTMIQGGSSTNQPTEAIPAAIAENVSLLLGLWASDGDADLEAEISALTSAIDQWGTAFTNLVVGISVGSEDLYRDSIAGIEADDGIGAGPADIVTYIGQVRNAIAGTSLSAAPIGHVDTWTAWVNGSNAAVIEACDWIGVDAYPYFQNTMSNAIGDAKSLFNAALASTQGAAGSKPVWITETGWPVSGSNQNLGVPSIENAETYWQEVGCPNFGNTNIFWYTLQDADPVVPNPSFGIVGSTLSTTPLFNLSCAAVSSSSQSATAAPTSTAVSGQSTGSASAAGSGSGSGSASPTGGSGSGSTTSSGSNPAGTAPLTVNGANALSVSFVGALGALLVAVAAM